MFSLFSGVITKEFTDFDDPLAVAELRGDDGVLRVFSHRTLCRNGTFATKIIPGERVYFTMFHGDVYMVSIHPLAGATPTEIKALTEE